MSTRYILDLQEVDKTMLALAGGKGANLGELMSVGNIRVPGGFCITTEAFQEVMETSEEYSLLQYQLSRLGKESHAEIRTVGEKIRKLIEAIVIPERIRQTIIENIELRGANVAYAVRSSATAEDLPTASFAGQQDTFLNVIGTASVLEHISRCWASLFTERAITYRMQNGFDHRKVRLCVIIQKMVFPRASGILFTADPVNGNRKVLSIDAGFGLGEALVSGLVNADHYKVRAGEIIESRIASKKILVRAMQHGGTEKQDIVAGQQTVQVLTGSQILQLAAIGRRIEKHFDAPQDIEWCVEGDDFYIVQSRPITTLYPVPQIHDQENHVYVSVGHQQMMTDAIKPLGLSFFLLIARGQMYTAGGRLFVDVAPLLASPVNRERVFNTLGQSDPLIRDALATILSREGFIALQPAEEPEAGSKEKPAISAAGFRTQIESDPAIAAALVKKSEASVAALKQNIQAKSGVALLDFIREDIQRLQKILFDPQSMRVIFAGIDASAWLNENMNEWLGEKNVADTISQAVSNNITSDMGMALLDVADIIRPYPAVIEYLQQVEDDDFLNGLINIPGGHLVHEALYSFLDRYGMRCAGEIDITKTRWSERPVTLVPAILSNIKNLEPNASTRKSEEGRQQAMRKAESLLSRLGQLPDGEQKVQETQQMISLIRNLIGYREYPKYSKISHYFVYKQALLQEAERLAQANVVREKEDIYYLTFDELHDVVRTHQLDYRIIDDRKEAYRTYEKLMPPRVMTSDGEIITGKYNREDLPSGAVAGLAVSSGIIEGRARVIFNMEDANIEDGDILVTVFTDPSWTPLFVSIKGLITEVGGLMTHGAVVAREYGLPAVVGVDNATKRIKDGQRIRLNGTDGYVEIL